MTRREAVTYIEECKRLHLVWARIMERGVREGKHWSTQTRAIGSPYFHRRVAREYEEILKVMRRG